MQLCDLPGFLLSPVFPDIRARAERLAAIIAAQHRPGRHEDRRQVDLDRPHDGCRRGLVAAGEQHDAVDRMRADEFLDLHGEEVAVEHRRRLHIGLGERHGRQLDRKAPRLPDTALDLLGASAQMRMARVDVAPGIDNRDHRLGGDFLLVVAHLVETGAMPEGAQVLGAEPAEAPKIFWTLAFAHRRPPLHS
ncbi:hypothetical protein ABIA14_005122 [Sinorhizobium fredii]